MRLTFDGQVTPLDYLVNDGELFHPYRPKRGRQMSKKPTYLSRSQAMYKCQNTCSKIGSRLGLVKKVIICGKNQAHPSKELPVKRPSYTIGL